MDIIAFTGPRGIGKTTICETIQKILNKYDNIYHLSFANFLREWNEDVFGYDLVKSSKEKETKDASYKFFNFRTISPLFNSNERLEFHVCSELTPRDILIKTGSFLREINTDIFCVALKKEIEVIFNHDPSSIVLIDDLRFDNEFSFLKDLPYCVTTVFLDRMDQNLESEKFKDFIDSEKCDIIFESWTYNETKENWLFESEVCGLIEKILGINTNIISLEK